MYSHICILCLFYFTHQSRLQQSNLGGVLTATQSEVLINFCQKFTQPALKTVLEMTTLLMQNKQVTFQSQNHDCT